MLSVRKSQIPEYLQDSEYYKSIQSEESFELSEEHYRKEIIIITFEDLIIYIRILDFWLVNKIPNEFYDWVYKNKDKINMDVLNEHFTNNHLLDEIQLIFNTNNIFYKAAKEGHLIWLKYAHKYIPNCKWGSYICNTAAEFGHLDCLKYAHENGCEMKETCELAAVFGHLDCLIYAHENGCPWDEYTCSMASEGGHLDCLIYALKKVVLGMNIHVQWRQKEDI